MLGLSEPHEGESLVRELPAERRGRVTGDADDLSSCDRPGTHSDLKL